METFRPLMNRRTPSPLPLSPTEGEGVRRTGEGDRRGFMSPMRVPNWRSELPMNRRLHLCKLLLHMQQKLVVADSWPRCASKFWRFLLPMKLIDRRSFLKNSLLGAAVASLAKQQPSASQTAARNAPVVSSSQAPGIIDTNVNLFSWPF